MSESITVDTAGLTAFARDIQGQISAFQGVDAVVFDWFRSASDYRLRVRLADDQDTTPNRLHEFAADYQLDLVVESFESREVLLVSRSRFYENYQSSSTVGDFE